MLLYTIITVFLSALSAAALPGTPTSTLRSPTTPPPFPGSLDGEPLGINLASVPPYEPIVTAPPAQDDALESLGYAQTTYYKCEPAQRRQLEDDSSDTGGTGTGGDGDENCGWHVPIVKVETANAVSAADSALVAVGVGAVAVVFVVGLL